jgi:sigma-B regulation protein RsbU (phosphoserine phosphatase)
MPPAPRILIADDQPDILQALRLLLGDAGYQTDLVSSVRDVVDRVAIDRSYDLLLMDLNYTRDTTSGTEGLELLDRVHAADGTLPVVVMTGWGSIETAVEAMRRGAKSFVQKPWDDMTLVDVVRREIADGRASRQRDARLTREHEEARLIQRGLLPAELPSMPGCDIAALWMPASDVGGDCYDALRLSPTRMGISIADVIGKGLPAALLMSNLQAAVRAFATADALPHAVCNSVNRLLCRNVAAGKFVTFCYAVVDAETRSIAYANAGHNPPILLHRDGRVDRLAATGAVLGVSADWSYATGRLDTAPGDRLVCFTDGITEAASPGDEQFGEARLLATIAQHPGASATDLVNRIAAAVRNWSGDALQDDATLVVVSFDPRDNH